MTEPITQSIERPGATITYDVRGDLAAPGQHPVTFVLGSPMDASGFGTLASHLTDRVVVTYDPAVRGGVPALTEPAHSFPPITPKTSLP